MSVAITTTSEPFFDRAMSGSSADHLCKKKPIALDLNKGSYWWSPISLLKSSVSVVDFVARKSLEFGGSVVNGAIQIGYNTIHVPYSVGKKILLTSVDLTHQVTSVVINKTSQIACSVISSTTSAVTAMKDQVFSTVENIQGFFIGRYQSFSPRRDQIRAALGPEGVALASSIRELIVEALKKEHKPEEGNVALTAFYNTAVWSLGDEFDRTVEDVILLLLFKLQERIINTPEEKWQELFDKMLDNTEEHFDLYGKSLLKELKSPLPAVTEERSLKRTLYDMKSKLHKNFFVTGDQELLNLKGTLFLESMLSGVFQEIIPEVLAEIPSFGEGISGISVVKSTLLSVGSLKETIERDIPLQLAKQLQDVLELLFQQPSINLITLHVLDDLNGDPSFLGPIPVRSDKKLPLSFDGKEEQIGHLLFHFFKILRPREVHDLLRLSKGLQHIDLLTKSPELYLGEIVTSALEESVLSRPIDYWKNLTFISLTESVQTKIRQLDLSDDEIQQVEDAQKIEVKKRLDKAIDKASTNIVNKICLATASKVTLLWTSFTRYIVGGYQGMTLSLTKGYATFSKLFDKVTDKLLHIGSVAKSMKEVIETTVEVTVDILKWVVKHLLNLTFNRPLIRVFINRIQKMIKRLEEHLFGRAESLVEDAIKTTLKAAHHPVHRSIGYFLVEDLIALLFPEINIESVSN